MPRQSQLTQSAMGEVYAAQEALSDLPQEDHEGRLEALRELAEVARQVQEQYAEAAESFGNAGENQERADELEGWVDQLETAVSEAESIIEGLSELEDKFAVADDCPL